MHRRDITFADRIAWHQSLATGRDNRSAETYNCTCHTAAEMNGHYAIDNRALPKNKSVKVRIQMLKRPPVSGSLSYLGEVYVSVVQ
jgi:hypothetical protein